MYYSTGERELVVCVTRWISNVPVLDGDCLFTCDVCQGVPSSWHVSPDGELMVDDTVPLSVRTNLSLMGYDRNSLPVPGWDTPIELISEQQHKTHTRRSRLPLMSWKSKESLHPLFLFLQALPLASDSHPLLPKNISARQHFPLDSVGVSLVVVSRLAFTLSLQFSLMDCHSKWHELVPPITFSDSFLPLSHERKQVMWAGDWVTLWTAPDSPSTSEAQGQVKQGGLVSGHRVGHESQGVSGVPVLELSVKRTTAQWFASGMYSVFDLCVRCFITQLYCNTHTVPSLVEILNKPTLDLFVLCNWCHTATYFCWYATKGGVMVYKSRWRGLRLT